MASVQCRSIDSIMGVEAQGKESMNVLSQGTPEELCRHDVSVSKAAHRKKYTETMYAV